MRFRPAQNGLLLVALLASCGQLIRGAPLASTADIDPWLDATATSPGLTAAPEARRREVEVDESIHEPDDSHLQGLLARGFPPHIPGKPPTPPPLPVPRPVPARPLPIPKVPRPVTAPRPVTPPRPEPPAPEPHAAPIPNNVNPGPGRGVGAEAKPMHVYELAGSKQLEMLDARIKSHAPDTLIVETEADVAKHPKNTAFLDINKNDELMLDTQDVRIHSGGELEILKEFGSPEIGFSMKGVGVLKQIAAYPRGSHAQFMNRATYDPEGRMIIFQDAFNELNVGKGAKRIPLNEMGLQNFMNVAGDKAKNLRAVFLMDVQNKEFWAITRECYNARGQPFTQILTFERGTAEFNRFMGSPNFNSKFFSFANHHDALGNKVPYKVIVIPMQHAEEGKVGKLTVGIVFKDA
ncbi:hypothetical protein E4U55_006699 [Claviceps digitariae]|nr:hypothetical protein E4U55_006699 [Claviceps digitariae]